jgi:hypothetical protein
MKAEKDNTKYKRKQANKRSEDWNREEEREEARNRSSYGIHDDRVLAECNEWDGSRGKSMKSQATIF